jgi:hypothetical protein
MARLWTGHSSPNRTIEDSKIEQSSHGKGGGWRLVDLSGLASHCWKGRLLSIRIEPCETIEPVSPSCLFFSLFFSSLSFFLIDCVLLVQLVEAAHVFRISNRISVTTTTQLRPSPPRSKVRAMHCMIDDVCGLSVSCVVSSETRQQPRPIAFITITTTTRHRRLDSVDIVTVFSKSASPQRAIVVPAYSKHCKFR